MTTWISRSILALGAAFALSACDIADGGNGFLTGLVPGDFTPDTPPLTQALMMEGHVTLATPNGFCIDRGTLAQSFALIARCDALGAAKDANGAPLGVMTVSFIESDTLPTPDQITAAAGLGAPEAARPHKGGAVFRSTGTPPAPALDPHHWRAVTRIGPYVMAAAIYGPPGTPATSGEGAAILQELIRLTTLKSQSG